MKRFEQLIQDAYDRLESVVEYTDSKDTTEDNKKQSEDLAKAKQDTDKAEDAAHDAGMDAEDSKQELAAVKTKKSSSTATKNRDKVKQMGG